MPRPAGEQHNHEFFSSMGVCEGHVHGVFGMTGPVTETAEGHVHEVLLFSSYNSGHLHYLSFLTGPPVQISEFEHAHLCEGISSCNDNDDSPHTHAFRFYTLAGPNLPPATESES